MSKLKEKKEKSPVTKRLGKSKKEKEFKLEAHLNDTVFKHEGDTLLEAVQAFVNREDFPLAVKTKVFLKYSHNGVERHKILPVSSARVILKRLRFDEDQAKFLADKLTRELIA